MKSYTTYPIEKEHAGYTVEQYLKEILHYSGRKIQKLTRQKGILLNGKNAYLHKKITAKDTLKVLTVKDTSYGVNPEQGSVHILYEDEHLLVVNKPPRQLVHPAGQTTSGTLANFLAYHFQQKGVLTTLRPLHRLDRDTSGCVVFAKNARSQFILEQQLKAGQLHRTYLAIVKDHVQPTEGTITAPIGPHPRQANRRAVNPNGDPAITHYRTVQIFQEHTLLELSLETGRTHQIRIHLSHLGYPLLGDGMYGVRSSLISRQALHACAVTFQAVDGKETITVQAPLPKDMSSALGQ